MLGEQQAINPNHLPSQEIVPSPKTDSFCPNSTGLVSQTADSTAYEHGVGSLSETNNVPAVMQSVGNAGVWTQQVVNDVIITSWQSESSSQPESNTQPESSSLPVQCEVCNITCNSQDVLEKHQNGKKHLKNLQKVAITSLFAPQMPPPATSAPSVGMLEDKKHKLLQNGASVDALIYCDICNVVCNNQDVFRMHLVGKKHSAKATARLANVNENSNLISECNPEAQPSNDGSQMKADTIQPAAATCELCKITCTSIEGLNVHLIGKKHLKKLQESQQIPKPPLIPATENVEPAEVTTRIANVYEISNNPEAQPSNGSSHMKPDTIQSATCELCKITCTSSEGLSVHLIGKKHLKKLQESQQIGIPTTENVEPAEGEGKSVISHEEKPSWCELCGINCTTYDELQRHISGKKHQKKLEMSQKPIGPNPAPGAMQNALKEEGKIVNVEGGKRKVKRVEDDGDLEAKKQKVLQGGATAGGLRTCTVCNVVCNSPTVFISHLAGQKHAAMAVKQAEAISNGQQT